jgi:hypothetical protein
MGRSKYTQPISVKITQSNSGACLIADAIKEQYPHLSRVSVDMVTIRVTDQARGLRLLYLTPPPAQHLLLSFDQAWPKPIDEITVRRPVQVTRIVAQRPGRKAANEVRRRDRLDVLEAKIAKGDALTRNEKISLTMLRKAPPAPPRPTSKGPREVHLDSDGTPTIVGGELPRLGAPHPNLLRGTNRHYGVKLAQPGQAFADAVNAEVVRRLAEREGDDQ